MNRDDSNTFDIDDSIHDMNTYLQFINDVKKIFNANNIPFGERERNIFSIIYNEMCKDPHNAFEIYQTDQCVVGNLNKINKLGSHTVDLPMKRYEAKFKQVDLHDVDDADVIDADIDYIDVDNLANGNEDSFDADKVMMELEEEVNQHQHETSTSIHMNNESNIDVKRYVDMINIDYGKICTKDMDGDYYNETPVEDKEKLTLDMMMIVVKYFKDSKDIINLIKTRRMYQLLRRILRFNPTDGLDKSFLPNLSTKHFYKMDPHADFYEDEVFKNVIWYNVNYDDIGFYPNNTVFKKVTFKPTIDDKNLQHFKVPEVVTDLDSSAFCYSNSTHIDLSNIKKLGVYSFGSSSIVSIKIPVGVTTIPVYCFDSCSHLKAVELPEGLETIENNAFSKCISLVTVHIPDSVYEIGTDAFYSCILLDCNIPKGLTRVQKDSFRLTDIKCLDIPESVLSLEEGCFLSCRNLRCIFMPESIVSLDYNSFENDKKVLLVCCPYPLLNRFLRMDGLQSLCVIVDITNSITYVRFSQDFEFMPLREVLDNEQLLGRLVEILRFMTRGQGSYLRGFIPDEILDEVLGINQRN